MRAFGAEAREVSSTGVFDPRVATPEGERTLIFRYEPAPAEAGGHFVDEQTGSRWIITGEAVGGPLAGTQLRVRSHGDDFAFVWFAFHPEMTVYAE